MRFLSHLVTVFIAGLIVCPTLAAQVNIHDQKEKKWYEQERWQMPKPNPQAKILPLIKVAGNKFVNANGDTIVFRGLSVSDPDKLEGQGHWGKSYFEEVQKMGAKLVRIPVHPIAWKERTPVVYLKLLDQAVSWCTELEMYVIIDWHSIGNLVMELFQNPIYDTTKKETYEFWRTIAGHFRGHNTVAFYEIFNEPTNFNGLLGNMSWEEWKTLNENIIHLIKAYDPETIPLVAGFDWAYDLNHLRYNPINAEGIAYVTHPYAMKRPQPWEPRWEENFGFAANKYPVMATEIGFGIMGEEQIDENHYGPRIINFLEEKNISWLAWIFDAEWHPHLFESWENYKLTQSGAFFKKMLHEKNKK